MLLFNKELPCITIQNPCDAVQPDAPHWYNRVPHNI